MSNTRRTVVLLTTKSLTNNTNSNNSKNNNSNTAMAKGNEVEGKKEKVENREQSRTKSAIFHSICLITLHVLDSMLLVILLPFIVWQWISANNRLKIILKAVVSVSLELIMWIIFAGVSILMTITFVLEDIYFGKNELDKFRQLANLGKESAPCDNGARSVPMEQDKLKTPEH